MRVSDIDMSGTTRHQSVQMCLTYIVQPDTRLYSCLVKLDTSLYSCMYLTCLVHPDTRLYSLYTRQSTQHLVKAAQLYAVTACCPRVGDLAVIAPSFYILAQSRDPAYWHARLVD